MPKKTTTLADAIDQAERNLVVMRSRFDPDAPTRMGLGDYIRGDDLPAAVYYRLRLAAVVAVRVPDAFADAMCRVQAMFEKHADLLAFFEKQQELAFARRGFAAPSHNHRTTATRARRFLRIVANWSGRFLRKHGEEFLVDFIEAVLDWADRWHLGDPEHHEVAFIVFAAAIGKMPGPHSERWPHAHVMLTMWCAAAVPYGIEKVVPLDLFRPASTKKSAIKVDKWNPMTESKAAGTARRIAEASAQIEAEADAAEAELLASGSRAPMMTSGHRHFEWFVRYQVLGESQRRIAEDVCVERVTVRAAIREIAEQAGLPLRERDRGGRPRKVAA